LATTDDARVHCAVLKIRAVPAVRALRRGEPVLAEEAQQAAVPSGPNSVLGPSTPRDRRSVPRSATVLAGPSWCPDRITSAPLTSSHLRTYA